MDILRISRTLSDVSQTVLKLSFPESQNLNMSIPTVGEYLSFTVTRLTRIEGKFFAKAERQGCHAGSPDYPKCEEKLRQEALEALAVRISGLISSSLPNVENFSTTSSLARLEMALNELEKIYDE